MDDGTVRCWGDINLTAASSATTSIEGLSGVVELAAGTDHTCARLSDGTVHCWGFYDVGVVVSGAAEIATGEYHSCARLTDGTVRCWGLNTEGQTAESSPTAAVANLSDVAEISAGGSHTCVRLKHPPAEPEGFDV